MEDTTMMEGGLFAGSTFTIIPKGLSDEDYHKHKEDLESSGGTVIPFDWKTGKIENLKEVTHIVATTSDFPDYRHALDLFIPVVKPSWIESTLLAKKHKNPRAFSPDPAMYMSEVIVHCAGIPECDEEAIAGGVIALGGQYSSALTKFVTHLVALDVNETTCQRALAKQLQAKIVLPHWFDDCLRLGRRISERPYLLPDPEILNVEAGAIPARNSPHIRGASTPVPTNDPVAPPTPSSEPSRNIHAFKGKKIMLGEDLRLNARLKAVIVDLIQAGGGEITSDVDEAHIYVCHWRKGDDYVKASRAKKDVGNLGWLYYMIAQNTWTSPTRRLMYYPLPPDGLPGFKNYMISISSYTGEARLYLENLVKATGATFTKTFKQDNTHLIAATPHSEKCEAAKEWGVHVINNLWLEESYAKCQEQTLTDGRFTHWPPRTNLQEILGQAEIDMEAVEKHFFKPEPKGRKPKTIVGIVQKDQDGVPGSSAPKGRADNEPVARSSPLTEKTSRRPKAGALATPAPARHTDGKENETPGSRGAKDRALSKIHDAAPDIAKYEKELKRKGGVVHGGRRDKSAEVEPKPKKGKSRESTGSKRSIDEVDDEDDATADEAENPSRKSKKAKKSLTPIKYRMLVSGDTRWIEHPTHESRDKAKLRELGLFINEDTKNVNLLCAPQIKRTKKFVTALAAAPTVVGASFLDYALKHNKLPDPEDHLLVDHEFEKANKYNLEESLERARQNKHRLLKNWTIFCTTAVSGGYDTYRDIITANGGKCHQWTGKSSNINATKRQLDAADEVSQNQQEDEGDILYLISEPNKKEIPLWNKFREMATKHDMVPRIVQKEWLLFVAMAQYVHWKPEWELSEESANKAKK